MASFFSFVTMEALFDEPIAGNSGNLLSASSWGYRLESVAFRVDCWRHHLYESCVFEITSGIRAAMWKRDLRYR